MCINWQADDTYHIKIYTLNLFSCYRPKGRSNNSSKARLGVCISPRIIWQAICLQYFYKLSCTNKVTVLCYPWLQAPATFLKVPNKAQELHIFTVKYRYCIFKNLVIQWKSGMLFYPVMCAGGDNFTYNHYNWKIFRCLHFGICIPKYVIKL